VSHIQNVGAFAFGCVLGWFAYYVNRYRAGKISVRDLGTFLGAIGGAAVLALFPAKSALFGYYGLGLAVGFFAYFVILFFFVLLTPSWNLGFFLDGRTPALKRGEVRGRGGRAMGTEAGERE
jgi:hypothetical protein